ncbi:MAG: hypothetical protein HUJ56_00860, partial [Erysipelotrichaceae bacterium]|nr:hypothetical protein [Erysipelotrichaceae bacterium]
METIKGNDHFRIEPTEDLGKEAQVALMLLYQPLVSHKGITLYNTLNLFNSYKLYSFNDVLKFTGLSIYDFTEAKGALEKAQLLKSYVHEKTGNYLLVLNAPLLPKDFFKQKAMMAELKKVLGMETLNEVLQSFQPIRLLNEEYSDISANPGYLSVAEEKVTSFGEI